MNPLLLQAAWAFVRQYWGHLAAIGLVLSLWLNVNSCNGQATAEAQLAQCLAKPPVKETIYVTITAKCKGELAVTNKEGSPCPDIKLDFGAESLSVAGAEKTTPRNGNQGAKTAILNGVYIGANYGTEGPKATASVQLGPLIVNGGAWLNTWEAGAQWRVINW